MSFSELLYSVEFLILCAFKFISSPIRDSSGFGAGPPTPEFDPTRAMPSIIIFLCNLFAFCFS